MRRKKDNKRVLRAGNGSSSKKRRKRFKPSSKSRFNNRFKPNNNRRSAPHMRQNRKPKRSGKTVLFVIIALIAFIIGAGVGISLSFDDGSVDNSTQVENVTDEMTTGLNESSSIVFNASDSVDYNENQSLGIIYPDGPNSNP